MIMQWKYDNQTELIATAPAAPAAPAPPKKNQLYWFIVLLLYIWILFFFGFKTFSFKELSLTVFNMCSWLNKAVPTSKIYKKYLKSPFLFFQRTFWTFLSFGSRWEPTLDPFWFGGIFGIDIFDTSSDDIQTTECRTYLFRKQYSGSRLTWFLLMLSAAYCDHIKKSYLLYFS